LSLLVRWLVFSASALDLDLIIAKERACFLLFKGQNYYMVDKLPVYIGADYRFNDISITYIYKKNKKNKIVSKSSTTPLC